METNREFRVIRGYRLFVFFAALHELRQAFRAVARSRALSVVIVVSLALGTGANAAVYSAVEALLFRGPAGVTNPESLVAIYTSQMNGGSYGESSFPDFQSIASADLGLRGVAASEDRGDAQLRFGGAAAVRRVATITDGYWDVLDVRLSQLRASTASEARERSGVGAPASERVGESEGRSPSVEVMRPAAPGAVLSEDAWKALGADPSAVGKTLTVDGREYAIAAIAPARFRGLHLDRVYDVWLPFDAGIPRGRGDRTLRVIGRLGSANQRVGRSEGRSPSVELEDFQHRLDGLAADLARAYPDTNVGTLRTSDEPRRMTALSYSRIDPSARWRATLLGAILLTATGLLLLSACVNAGSLLLSRGLARRAELTIKTALGAARPRLVRAILLESVILATAGAAGGLLVARWTSASIPALFAPEHAALIDARVPWPVIVATMAIGFATGLLCGLAPALAATRSLPVEALRGDPSRLGERPGAARLRMSLVAAQLALSTVFLAGAVLMSRAIDSTLRIDRSLAEGTAAVAAVETFDPDYRDRAMTALRALPSVSRAGWVSTPPLHTPIHRDFRIQRDRVSEIAEIGVNFASREYYEAARMYITEGRFPRREEEIAGDVVIVNEALARRYFGEKAVGSTLTDTAGSSAVIVGVVRERVYRALEGAQHPIAYFPMTRSTSRAFHALVRAHDPASGFQEAVASVLNQAGTTLRVEVTSFDDLLSRALATERMVVRLIAACGALALLLAAAGVYGVMGDLVRRRTREIGLRLALGAGPLRLLQDVMGASLGPAFAGLAAGAGATVILTRVARTFVYELPSADAVTLAAVTAGLSIVVIAAVVPPAWRALRVSPLVALRD